MSADYRINIAVSYVGKVDAIEFFGKLSTKKRESYWTHEIDAWLREWGYLYEDPWERASGYIARTMTEAIEMFVGHGYVDGANVYDEIDADRMLPWEEDDEAWVALVNKHAWLAVDPRVNGEDDREFPRIDPGGTIPFDISAH